MTICKFWRAGHCKFGDQCRFEHPSGQGGSQPAQKHDTFMRQPQDQHQNQNRFGQPNSNRNNQNQNSQPNNQHYSNQQQSRGFRDYKGSRGGRDPQPYGVTRAVIQEDLAERPNWIMSCYGPGKDPDIQLFGGYPLEHSPEEVRVLHYQYMAAGNPQQSAQAEGELAQMSNEQVDAVSKDLSGALHYLANGSKDHPNRIDICRAGTSNLKRNGDGPFSKSTRHREINDQRRALGSAGFGQQPQQAGGFASQQPGFGSAPQNPPNQHFGSAGFNTGFGGQSQPTFGQQPQVQPSSFGAPQSASFGVQPPQIAGFGQPDQPMSSPQMGQPNPAFGANPNNSNFPQPQPQQQPQPMNNAFGQPPIQQQPMPFSNSPQPQPQQQQQPGPSLFGAQPMNPQQQQQAFNPGFNQQQQQQQQQTPMTMNGFQPQQQPNGLGQGGNPQSNGDVNSYTTRDASNKLLTWKGRPVNYVTADEPCYKQDQGSWERIWFPDGEPPGAATNASQAAAFATPDQYPSDVKEAYGVLMDSGLFKDGVVPEVAPLGGMVRWDL